MTATVKFGWIRATPDGRYRAECAWCGRCFSADSRAEVSKLLVQHVRRDWKQAA
jgi:hypothetical protein